MNVTVSPEMPIADRLVCPGEAFDIHLAPGPAGGALAVWIDDRWYDLGSTDVYAARIDSTGLMLDVGGIMIADDAARSPTAAFETSTSTWLVAWRGSANGDAGVYAKRLASSGTVLDLVPIGIASTGGGDDVTTAASPGQFLVVWETGTQMLARRVSASGMILDAAPIVLGAAGILTHPQALFDGTSYVVVWGASGVQGVRISTTGAVLSPGPIALVSGGNNTVPSIVQGNSEFLLAWHAPSLKHMRLTMSLAPIDSPQTYYAGQHEESLTFDGSRYMIADTPGTLFSTALHTHYISQANGNIGHAEYTTPGHTGYDTGAVFTGTQQLVAFTSNQIMRGVRVALDGSFLDATPPVWSTTLNDQTHADIAFDPAHGHLVVWRDSRDDDNDKAIYATQITPGGGLHGTGVRVSGAGFYSSDALAVAHGRGPGAPFVVVWHEHLQPSFHAARLDGSGQVLDPGGFTLYANAGLDTDDQGAFGKNLACTMVSCLFAWRNPSTGTIIGIRFRLDGTVLDSTPISIGSGAIVRMSANANTFLVSVQGFRGYFVPEDGPPSSTIVNLPGTPGAWDILWDGSRFIMAWYASSTEIQITRLDATAQEIGPRVTVPVSLSAPFSLRVIQDGADALVVWWSESAIHAARYTGTGVLRDPGGLSLGTTSGPFLRIGDVSAGTFPIVEEHRARQLPGVGTWETMRWVAITGMGGGGMDAGVMDAGVSTDAGVVTDAAASTDAPVMPADASSGNDGSIATTDAAMPGGDAGFGDSGNSGGCCQTGSSPDFALAIAILAIVLRRREQRFDRRRHANSLVAASKPAARRSSR